VVTAEFEGRIMQLTLTDRQAQVLADALKARLDTITAGIAKADTRDFRDRLMAEGDTLDEVYAQLGCAHPEWSEARTCAVKPGPTVTAG
jgi:hypothetical protein